ncbi:MAG: ChaN family lipoprotein [Planctomycetes bacterium]|nr:ChaN family lipoprotein [Planctomycetota bacterium]
MIKKLAYLALFLSLAAILNLAYSEDKPAEPSKEKAPEAPPWMQVVHSCKAENVKNKILNIKKGGFISFDDMVKDISKVPVVFIGEMHMDVSHHLVQEKVFKALYDKSKDMVLGLEMFQHPYQKDLNAYLKNEITETDMLKNTEYEERWGYPWEFYRPTVLFAKANKLPVIALNVPAEITRKVAQKGLKGLSDEEKKQIPESIDTANEAHKKYINSIFGEGDHSKMMNMDNFYEAQCLWEDGMADAIAKYFKSAQQQPPQSDSGDGTEDKKPRDNSDVLSQPGQMVVFVGGGHIIYKFGIPERMAKRTNMAFRTILLVSVEGLSDFKKGLKANNLPPADYVYFTEQIDMNKKTPTIGLMIEPAGDDKEGMKIAQVNPGSPGEKAGLEVGDIIIAIDGKKTSTAVELKMIMMEKKAGDEIELTVIRGGEEKKIKVKPE